MAAPIVYFEVAGPDAAQLRAFYAEVFDWQLGADQAIPAARRGGPRGGIRQDPPATLFYVGVPDIDATIATITARGGGVVLPRTVVPGVVTFALVRDPAGNVVGLAEDGSYPDSVASRG